MNDSAAQLTIAIVSEYRCDITKYQLREKFGTVQSRVRTILSYDNLIQLHLCNFNE